MSGVPYTFATATTSIPLSQLDANFATNATLGNATVGLGNTTTTVGNLTVSNVTISGGTGTLGNVTLGNITNAAGTAPAFSAYQSSAQTISSNTYTKIQFQTKEYDTANAFDATTNYRFQPTVAGYYSINGGVGLGTGTGVVVIIYKNGSSYKNISNSYGLSAYGSYGSGQVYLNGSTDYVELYVYLVVGEALASGSLLTYFQASMVRSA